MFNIKKLIVLLLCANLVFQAQFGIAGPQGGKVVDGNANISQSGSNTTINQTSDRAIINWNSFDIGKNESVRHNMPSSNSAGLHRVVSKGGPSQIEGLLQSNGNIYLVNPAGVVIHNGAKIDVNGFVATTRDIANENFMKGNMVFDKPGMPGAAIINQGNISLKDNGLAVLVAPTVRNDGIIAGKLGKVALGGSDAAWKLDMTGDDLIAFTMDERTVNTLYAADGTPLASVQNNGKIKAEGGVVVLTASQLDGIVGSVVNNGEISAASAEIKGGKIIFRGQGNQVDLVNNGLLDVSTKTAEGGVVRMNGQAATTHAGKIDATGKTKGGEVVIIDENVTLKSGSRIDVSGTNGGGTVLVGGNAKGKGPESNAKTTLVQSDAEILADAKLNGDGGQIVVWADEKTQFDGKATASGGENGGDGGMVETSAKLLIIGDPAVVNTSAKKGKTGTWLMDPDDFVIAKSGGDITGEKLSYELEKNNIYLKTNNEGGDIFINDLISWIAGTTLAIASDANININDNIILKGNNAKLILNYKNGNLNINSSKISFLGKNCELIINDNKYNLLYNINDLQSINNGAYSTNFFALADDIDAQETISWNNGEGFYSIYIESLNNGNKEQAFNGLGHAISKLYMNNMEKGKGLFSTIPENYYVTDLQLLDFNIITTNRNIGSLSSSNFGIVKNVHVSGSISNDHNLLTGGSIGGLIANNYNTILNSSSKCYIMVSSGHDEVSTGGLVGKNYGIIKRSFSHGEINGDGSMGGLIGLIDSNKFLSRTDSIKVIDCFTDVKIKAIKNKYNYIFCGGLVGSIFGIQNNYKFDINIINSYANGSIKIDKLNDQKELYGIKKFNAFIGRELFSPYIIIENSYWNTDLYQQMNGVEASDNIYINNLNGLTDIQMKNKNSFIGFDFNNTWKIDEGKSYPELRRFANDVILPNPAEPTPPIVEPDPKPDIPINPENPDQPEISVTPETVPNQKPGNPYPNGPYIHQPNRSGELNTHYIKDGESITVGGEMKVIMLDENGNKTISPISSSLVADNSWKESESENNIISPTRAREIMSDLMKAVEKEIGRQIYDSLNDIKKSEEEALKRIKKCINTSPPSKWPDGVYEAFAKAIFEAAKKSEFATYGKAPYEFTKEFTMSFLGGKVSGIKYITINGVTYEISLEGVNLGGVGLNSASVSWKDSNNRTYNITLSFVNSINESADALANYCEALVKMQNNAMQEAIKYFVDDISAGAGNKAVKLIKFGQEVIEAVMDTKKGEELGKNIGKYFANEFTGKAAIIFGDNKFTRFLDTIGAGAEKITGMVEKYNEVKNLVANLQETYTAGKVALENRDDLYSSISALSDFSNFSRGSANALISYLKKEDKSDKSAVLNNVTYYDRPTTDELRSDPDSEKVKNFVEEKDGKYRLKM